MKGYRFFEEFKDDKRRERAGNCVAVLLNDRGQPLFSDRGNVDAVAAVYDRPNSPVAGTVVSRGFLRDRCARRSEAVARSIHPQLFAYLDDD